MKVELFLGLFIFIVPLVLSFSEEDDDWFSDMDDQEEEGTSVAKPPKKKEWTRANYCDHEPFTTVILKLILDIKDDMKSGNDSIGMPRLDPLNLSKVEYQVQNSQYKFKLNGVVENVYVKDLSIFDILDIESDLSELSSNISIRIPNILISGDYHLRGKFASIIPLNGNGRFSLNTKNTNCSVFAKLSFGENEIIKLDYFDFKFKVEDLQVNFGGIMGFGRKISGAVNKVLNLAGLRIFNKLEPMMHEKLRSNLIKKINKVFKDWTYDEVEFEKMMQLPLMCMFG